MGTEGFITINGIKIRSSSFTLEFLVAILLPSQLTTTRVEGNSWLQNEHAKMNQLDAAATNKQRNKQKQQQKMWTQIKIL